MKVSKKELNLLLGFLGILFAFCAYQFCYKKAQVEIAALDAESVKMEAEIAKYEALLENKDFYVSETERMHGEIVDYLNEFPSNTLSEDEIKFAYNLDDEYDPTDFIFINAMNFTEPELTYTTMYGESQGLYPVYSLYKKQFTMGVLCSYTGLKEIVAAVYEQNNRKAVDSVTLSFDASTGQLNGSVAMSSYFVTGMDKPYGQPQLAPVKKGTDNIFGTVVIEEDEAE